MHKNIFALNLFLLLRFVYIAFVIYCQLVRQIYIDLLILYSYINTEKRKKKVMETIATTKGQIVISSKVRSRLGIKEGTRIQIDIIKSK
jgi:AbrB family looped-hinge helix DNA binding protein